MQLYHKYNSMSKLGSKVGTNNRHPKQLLVGKGAGASVFGVQAAETLFFFIEE